MVDELKIGNGVKSYSLSYNPNTSSPFFEEEREASIFSNFNREEDKTVGAVALYAQLDAVNAEQGAFSEAWNGFKEFFNVGTSSEKCEDAIQRYINGEISLEEATSEIEEFKAKQGSSLNLFSNIATGITAIAAASIAAATIAATGGTATPLILATIGAGTGALTKSGMKTADRATNDIEGDALNAKQIIKDGLSGAVTGAVGVYSMGTAAGKSCVAEAVIGCTKTGIKTGAISGSSNYMIETAFEEDKKFNTGDFLKATAESAIVGGTVGAIMGGVNGTLHATGTLNSGCSFNTLCKAGIGDGKVALNDVVANSGCTTSYKVLNDRIRAIAA